MKSIWRLKSNSEILGFLRGSLILYTLSTGRMLKFSIKSAVCSVAIIEYPMLPIFRASGRSLSLLIGPPAVIKTLPWSGKLNPAAM